MVMKKLNRNQIKYIAIAAMLIDHIAWAFVPTVSVLGQTMHFVGRFTGPSMCYFLYEGFVHTSDKTKYGTRLALFALASWIPFCSFEYGAWCIAPLMGMIYTLFLGFLGMCWCERAEKKNNGRLKLADCAVIVGLCILSLIGDWPVLGVLWPVMLYIYRNDEQSKWSSFWIINVVGMVLFLNPYSWKASICELGCIIPGLVLQYGYDGTPGKKTAFSKWFFYIFYPLHLAVLTYIKIKLG